LDAKMSPTPHDELIIDMLEAGGEWGPDIVRDIHDGALSAVMVAPLVWEGSREAIADLARWQRRFRRHADALMPGLDAADVLEAKRTGRTAIIYGSQNGSVFEDDLDLVWVLYRLGMRVAQLTYNNQNMIGSGCAEQSDDGLSRFGRLVVAEMDRVGMLIDLSHVGERTSLDAIAASQHPVAVTHANPKSWYEHRRNKSETVLRAVAERGGVVGLTPYPEFAGEILTVARWCELITRTVDVVGIAHVGIGTDMARGWADFAGHVRWVRSGRWMHPDEDAPIALYPPFPEWLGTASRFRAMPAMLRAHGFSAADSAAVMGGNWLRLLRQVLGDGTVS
jgi:membrane dipeptidase